MKVRDDRSLGLTQGDKVDGSIPSTPTNNKQLKIETMK